MSYPDGVVSPLTTDLTSYVGVDLDGSRTALVTTRRETRTSVWVGDAAGAAGTEVVPPTLFTGRFVWVSWAGARLLYNTTDSGRAAVAVMRPGNAAEDLAPQGPNVLSGAGTSDGRTLVFAKRADGLWRTDAAGRSPVQLSTHGSFDVRVTPDDRHVVFLATGRNVESPWIVPIDGGEATEVFDRPANWGSMDVSPDGRLLVTSEGRMVICDLPACASRREAPLPANFGGRHTRWMPDGQRIAYIEAGGANLWSVGADGEPPRPLTRFPADASGRAIAAFAWSRDGQRLAIVHATTTSDIVLVRGLQP